MYFDGGAAPNPGNAHICVRLGDDIYFSKIGYNTNNMAEWMALCWGMLIAKSKGIKHLDIIGDSKLVVNQAQGRWKIKKHEFNALKYEFDSVRPYFKHFSLTFQRREHNLAGHYIEGWLKKRKRR